MKTFPTVLFNATGRRQSFFLSRCRGFTLLETVTTLAICGILAAIAVPIWSTLLPGYQLNAATRQVATEFHSVRNRAMAQYRRFRIVFDSATTYRVERENTPGAADYTSLGGPKILPGGVTAASSGTPVFQTRGDASPPANITLSNSQGVTKVVAISSAGRVEIQ